MLTGTIGRGTTVHRLSESASHRALCGSGNCTIGTRRFYNGRVTGQPVTCKKCLRDIADEQAHAQAEAVQPMKWNDISGPQASLEEQISSADTNYFETITCIGGYIIIEYWDDRYGCDTIHRKIVKTIRDYVIDIAYALDVEDWSNRNA